MHIYTHRIATRSLFGTSDMPEQGKLLNEVAALVDAGNVRSTGGE